MSIITIIEPQKKFAFPNLRELWLYRELLYSFVVRDLKVRYRQTVIGGLWAILQPLTTMVVFSVFFGTIAKIGSEGVPYPIFSYAGLLLWIYFSSSVGNGSNSLVGSAGLLTKIYFPRLIIPISAVIVGLVDYAIAFIVLGGLMWYYHIVPTVAMLGIPLLLLLTLLLSSGISFWLSAINVKYHDVRFVLPFFIQLMMFFTPVIYPISVAPNYRLILALNPMSGIVEAHRAMILGNQPINWELLGISALITLVIFITGGIYFRSVEKNFADII